MLVSYPFINNLFLLTVACSIAVMCRPLEDLDNDAFKTEKIGPLCSYNGYWLNCSNFDSFEVLSANFRNKTYREQELLIIRPLQKLDLEALDLTGFNMKYVSLELANINSFPYIPDPAKNLNAKSLYIKESNLEFLHDNKSIGLMT